MDPQLLRRGGQRRERKIANVETVCECVRDGPGSSGCPILNTYLQTIVWISIQTYVAWQFFQLTAHGRHVRGDATQTTFQYLSTDYRLDKYSKVYCFAIF